MRRAVRSAILLAFGTAAVLVRDASAQTASDDGTRLTSAGVYTPEQAARGRDTFAASCQGCHTPASHTGAAFRNGWGGHLLSELLAYISERMPKNEPGSLAREEYVDLAAYILSLNGMPSGRVELSSDAAALRKIRIDLGTKGGP